MMRPCYLVVDQEYSSSISTRKLVIETAKFNVITAYSGQEAIDTLKKFPAVDGIVVDAGIPEIPCEELVARLKEISPAMPVIAVGSPRHQSCAGADHFVESFQPTPLLALLQSLQPNSTAAVEKREEKLKNEEC
jgi:response regulator RpfG family c-di-GMP phosphodiesterase